METKLKDKIEPIKHVKYMSALLLLEKSNLNYIQNKKAIPT